MSHRQRRRTAAPGAAVAALLGFAAFPAVAAAHGLAGRADLPIPAELFGAAAAAVLVVSFLALAAGWSRPRLEEVAERRLFRLPVAFDVLAGALGVAAFALVVYAGLAGPDSQRDNLAPNAVFVIAWVGIPLLSLLFGDVFRAISPWRAVGRAAGWVGRRVAGSSLPEPLPYPGRLGRWPAVAGLIAFGVIELCWGQGREPGTLAVLMLLYFAVQLVGMSLYGVEAWTRDADAFGGYFSLFALLAPLARRDDGTVVARTPGTGATGLRTVAGTVALLIAAIGTTAFDGFREGPIFSDAAPSVQDFFTGLGASKGTGLELTFATGYALMLALVALIWWIAVEGMPRLRAKVSRDDLSRRLAHSLIPIAAAYVLAHYFSLLAYQGQDAIRLLSDPLGDGDDLLGTADREIDYGVISATGIWYVQVAALVIGHVGALVLGHDRALTIYGSARAAARSQAVMLVVMVCFTCLGLYLLSAANA